MPRPLLVLGMHRSGTSMLTQLLHAMGCHAGAPHELAGADTFNPTGYWEHRAVFALDEHILAAVGGSWFEPADLRRLSLEQSRTFVERARAIARVLEPYGNWVIKDPRMVLVFDIWREAVPNAVAVMIWRDPLAVARSLAGRQGFDLPFGVLLWEHYVRAMLAGTLGMPRVLVSHRELLDDPAATTRALHADLAAVGVELTVPDAATRATIVRRDLERSSAPADVAVGLLNSRVLDLVAALQNRAVLSWTDVPALPPAPRAALGTYAANWRRLAAADLVRV